jgi:hypothetical protein
MHFVSRGFSSVDLLWLLIETKRQQIVIAGFL